MATLLSLAALAASVGAIALCIGVSLMIAFAMGWRPGAWLCLVRQAQRVRS